MGCVFFPFGVPPCQHVIKHSSRTKLTTVFSPCNSPLSYPAANRYSSSSLSSQASAEVSNITGQSESSDEVFNMQVLYQLFVCSRLFLFCLHHESVCPFCGAHEQTFKQELDLRTNLLKKSQYCFRWPLESTKMFLSKLPITLRKYKQAIEKSGPAAQSQLSD